MIASLLSGDPIPRIDVYPALSTRHFQHRVVILRFHCEARKIGAHALFNYCGLAGHPKRAIML